MSSGGAERKHILSRVGGLPQKKPSVAHKHEPTPLCQRQLGRSLAWLGPPSFGGKGATGGGVFQQLAAKQWHRPPGRPCFRWFFSNSTGGELHIPMTQRVRHAETPRHLPVWLKPTTALTGSRATRRSDLRRRSEPQPRSRRCILYSSSRHPRSGRYRALGQKQKKQPETGSFMLLLHASTSTHSSQQTHCQARGQLHHRPTLQ